MRADWVLLIGGWSSLAVWGTPSPASANHLVQRTSRVSGWLVVETPNFHLCCQTDEAEAKAFASTCEALRDQLAQRWLGRTAETWTPKCHLILHATAADYARESGPGSERTRGSSIVERHRGTIQKRRIDLRSDVDDYCTAALPHELTHVVLCDAFAEGSLPRWADEGIALLADPPTKQRLHHKDLHAAFNSGHSFRLTELLTLSDYPAAHRWGAFYGQSASLVRFLVEEKGPSTFVAFLDAVSRDGYDAALRDVYGISHIGDLEARWLASLRPSAS